MHSAQIQMYCCRKDKTFPHDDVMVSYRRKRSVTALVIRAERSIRTYTRLATGGIRLYKHFACLPLTYFFCCDILKRAYIKKGGERNG